MFYLFSPPCSVPNDTTIIFFISIAFGIEAQHHRVFVQLQGLFQITYATSPTVAAPLSPALTFVSPASGFPKIRIP